MAPQPPAIKAVLFDYDGVLVASEPLHWAAWGNLLTELDIQYQPEELCAFAGRTAPQIMTSLLAKYRPDYRPTAKEIEAFATRKNEFYLKDAERNLKTYPGVVEGLEWLRQSGVRAAIVSNGRRRELRATIQCLGLTGYFDAIISREDSGCSKPDPQAYLFACDLLGLVPGDCLAVEDSPPGLIAALRAHIPAAAVLTNFSRHEMKTPVPNQPELQPFWIGAGIPEFFSWLRTGE